MNARTGRIESSRGWGPRCGRKSSRSAASWSAGSRSIPTANGSARSWVSLGIPVAFHTTLGDDLDDTCRGVPGRFRPRRPGHHDRRPGADPGRPDARGARRLRRRAAGRGPRFAGGDRGDVRPAQPGDGRAEPHPGPVPPKCRAAGQPGRHGARHLDASRPGDVRLPARRPLRDEADVPGAGRPQAEAVGVRQHDHRPSQDQPVRQGRVRHRGPGDGPDGPGPGPGGRDHRA